MSARGCDGCKPKQTCGVRDKVYCPSMKYTPVTQSPSLMPGPEGKEGNRGPRGEIGPCGPMGLQGLPGPTPYPSAFTSHKVQKLSTPNVYHPVMFEMVSHEADFETDDDKTTIFTQGTGMHSFDLQVCYFPGTCSKAAHSVAAVLKIGDTRYCGAPMMASDAPVMLNLHVTHALQPDEKIQLLIIHSKDGFKGESETPSIGRPSDDSFAQWPEYAQTTASLVIW